MREHELLLRKGAVYLFVLFVMTRVATNAWSLLSDLFVIVVSAMFLSFAIEPGVAWFEKRRVRRGLATGFMLFSSTLCLGGLLVAAGAVLASQAGQLADALPAIVTELIEQINRVAGSNISASSVLADGGLVQRVVNTAQDGLISVGAGALGVFGQLLTTLFLTFYFSADAERIISGVCSLVRPHRQARVREVINTARSKTGSYLATRAVLSGLSATFHTIVFVAIGVPYAVPLGLWVGVVSQVIPVIGTYLAVGLPVVVTLGSGDGLRTALIIVAAATLYQQIENNVLSPRVTRATMSLHPVVGLLSVIVGGRIAGVPGALFAIPVAASISSIVGSYIVRHEVALDGGEVSEAPASGESPGE